MSPETGMPSPEQKNMAVESFWSRLDFEKQLGDLSSLEKEFKKLSPDEQAEVRARLKAIIDDDSHGDGSPYTLSGDIAGKVDARNDERTPRERRWMNANVLLGSFPSAEENASAAVESKDKAVNDALEIFFYQDITNPDVQKEFLQQFQALNSRQRRKIDENLRTLHKGDFFRLESDNELVSALEQKVNSGDMNLTNAERQYYQAAFILHNQEYQEALDSNAETSILGRMKQAIRGQFARAGRVTQGFIDGGRQQLTNAWQRLKAGWQKVDQTVDRVMDKVTKPIGPESAESKDEKLQVVVSSLREQHQELLAADVTLEAGSERERLLAEVRDQITRLEEIRSEIFRLDSELGTTMVTDEQKEKAARMDDLRAEFTALTGQVQENLRQIVNIDRTTAPETVVEEAPVEETQPAVPEIREGRFSKEGRLRRKAEKLEQQAVKIALAHDEFDQPIQELVAQLTERQTAITTARRELEQTDSVEDQQKLIEQLAELEAPQEELAVLEWKQKQLFEKIVLLQIDKQIALANAEVERLRYQLRSEKDPVEQARLQREIDEALLQVETWEEKRESRVDQYGMDVMETGRRRLVRESRESFAENGRWTVDGIREMLSGNREQAFWLALQMLAAAAGGAPMLAGVSGVAILREAVRAGVIPAEKIPLLQKLVQEHSSAEVYQGIAGPGQADLFPEIAGLLPAGETPELNRYQRNVLRLLKFVGNSAGVVARPLVWVDRKILGVLNQAVENRARGYSEDLVPVLENATAATLEESFHARLQEYFKVGANGGDKFRKYVEGENFRQVETHLGYMEQMMKDIFVLRAQGGALAGGEMGGLRRGQIDTRLFAPDVLDAWQSALARVIEEATTVFVENGENLSENMKTQAGRLALLSKENSYQEKAVQQAENKTRRRAFAARVIRLILQGGLVHIVSNALRGQESAVEQPVDQGPGESDGGSGSEQPEPVVRNASEMQDQIDRQPNVVVLPNGDEPTPVPEVPPAPLTVENPAEPTSAVTDYSRWGLEDPAADAQGGPLEVENQAAEVVTRNPELGIIGQEQSTVFSTPESVTAEVLTPQNVSSIPGIDSVRSAGENLFKNIFQARPEMSGQFTLDQAQQITDMYKDLVDQGASTYDEVLRIVENNPADPRAAVFRLAQGVTPELFTGPPEFYPGFDSDAATVQQYLANQQ